MVIMKQPRVLVVEDENIIALDICQSLRRSGYTVDGPVRTAQDAIEHAKRERPDVVLMDIVLKGAQDGISAAQTIHTTTGASVVFITAHADQETAQRAQSAHPSRYLIKPFDEAELHEALQEVLRKSAHGAHEPESDG